MDEQQLNAKTIAELRDLAETAGIKSYKALRKQGLIEALLAGYNAAAKPKRGRKSKAELANGAEAAPPAAEETVPPQSEPQPAEGAESAPLPQAAEKAESAAPAKSAQEAPKSAAQGKPAAGHTARKPQTSESRRTRLQAQHTARSHGQGEKSGPFTARNHANKVKNNHPPENRPVQEKPAAPAAQNEEEPRRREVENRPAENAPGIPELLGSGDCGEAEGILDIHADGYGFLRALNPNQKDVYLSIAQIRRFNLRPGDHIVGKTRPERENERYLAMLYITSINGMTPEEAQNRKQFDSLTPIFPQERITLEMPGADNDLAIRLIDLVSPIGKGQRGLIVSPPKAGKTTLLKRIANGISANYPEIELIVLLVDERPEEVTDMQRSTQSKVYYSTFDERPENHCRVAEMVLERAKRMVEAGKDVVILLDSITRLARAYNITVPPSGRSLSGGLDPGALFKPKRFFGAARNIEEMGSLTIIATALVDTGSRMDDIIYEEFKGTGNMELHLDRKLQERRVFPALDLYRSGTRREELLLSPQEMEGIWSVRKLLSGSQDDATELLIDMMAKTQTNEQFLKRLSDWLKLMEKEGYQGRRAQQ